MGQGARMDNLKTLRAADGRPISVLATQAGVSDICIKALEDGGARDHHEVANLCAALGVDAATAGVANLDG